MTARLGLRRALAAVAAILGALAFVAPASARDATVTSFDGTPISTHFFPAAGLPPGAKAPTLLIGPGWSQQGETNPNSTSNPILENFGVTPIGTFVNNGYNVLTWDPRGFGRSGGTVMIDDYRFEGRDTQALIDFVAQQPEAWLDGPGDPHAGMAGASYGGIIQLVTAGIDGRIDAIAPNISPHNLTSSLFKERSVKAGWGLILVGAGIQGAVLQGLIGYPPQTGHLDPHFYNTVIDGITNTISDENYNWFAEKGPGFLVKNIRVPTLLTQGLQDTLFTPQEAIDNYNVLAANSGAPLKMMWFCGGHGVCATPAGPTGYLKDRMLAWFDRFLKGENVDTGPRFEWLAEDGLWRSAANYPLKSAGELTATGSGVLPITPVQTSGALILATPVALPGTAAELPIPGPQSASDVLGVPRLKLTYSGTAVPAKTFVYAQLVDSTGQRVVGHQATPIPLTLDGQEHRVQRPLEPIASRAPAGGGYKLQIVPHTTLYGAQLSLGVATLESIDIRVPLVDAAGTPPPTSGLAPQSSIAPRKKKARRKRCKKLKNRGKRKRCLKRRARKRR